MIVFDTYEMRARLAPALVVASPWVLVAVALAQSCASTLLSTSAAAVIFVTLLYAFSFVVRHLGRRIEERLWTSWGGPPTAMLLGEVDGTFNEETRSRIRSSLETTLGIQGVSEAGWTHNVDKVQEAFRIARQHIRQRDPRGLWSTHNAEYGFLRNLLGSWWLMLVNALLATGACSVHWRAHGDKTIFVLGVLNFALALFAIAGRIFVLPSLTRTAAFRYAESAWTSFLANAQKADDSRQGDDT